MFTNERMSTNISSSVSPRIVGRGSSSSGIINQEISPLCVLDFLCIQVLDEVELDEYFLII
jgi:hypothetical protein